MSPAPPEHGAHCSSRKLLLPRHACYPTLPRGRAAAPHLRIVSTAHAATSSHPATIRPSSITNCPSADSIKIGDHHHAKPALLTRHQAHRHLLRQCNCGCAELYLDHTASPERCVIIGDDFGQRIHRSLDQLHDLVTDVKAGVLDSVLAATTP